MFDSSSAIAAPPTVEIQIELNRHAFYRGEEIVARVACTNHTPDEIKAPKLLASVAGTVQRELRLDPIESGKSIVQLIRIPTEGLRCESYSLSTSLTSETESIAQDDVEIVIARRTHPGRMPVWLWPHKAFLDQIAPFDEGSETTIDWWADHGVTDLAVGEHDPEAMLKALDYSLAAGLSASIMPVGGLAPVKEAFADEPADSDLWFRKLGESEPAAHKLLNPWHPRAIAWHEAEVEKLMRRVGGYPHIRTAFFNSEIVDQLTVSDNDAGKRLVEQSLAFSPRETGEPKWVAPGVIADDDRRVALHRFAFKKGNGYSVANARTASLVHRFRPDILTINDPYRSWALLDGFPGLDVVGSWTYTNPDPKLMLYVETLRAACRGTDQVPLSIVTLLNYPGEQTPSEKDWTMMGPGRLAVTTWINLSRAPRILGYYFSSGCDPFSALEDDLVTPKKDVSKEALPPATYEMLQSLSKQVIQPFGALIRESEVAPRRIAVLSSDTSSLFRRRPALLGSYGNMQVHHFYTLLAMAHLPADVLFEEHIAREGLDDYDVLVLPQCDVLPKTVYDRVIEFQKRGGLIIADQNLGPEIPGVLKFNFDFDYRVNVTAMAIANGRGFANWNDHLQPDTAGIKSVNGVSALEDQRIMESYAKELRETLGDRIPRAVDSSEPTALVNLLEAAGGQVLVVINDKRDYDETIGRYKSVMDKIVPQTATITLPGWQEEQLAAYDLVAGKQLDVKRTEGKFEFQVELAEIGGTIVALYPKPLADLKVVAPKSIARGSVSPVAVQIFDTDGIPPTGIQPVRVTILDTAGNKQENTDYYNLKNGMATIDLAPALNDLPGTWEIVVDDLTSGRQVKRTIEVVDPISRSAILAR